MGRRLAVGWRDGLEIDERLPRRLEMILPFGDRRVDQQRIRVDWIAVRRLPERMLGAVDVAFLEQRAPVEQQRLAGRRGIGGDTLERFMRLAEEGAIVARSFQPDLSQRAIEVR